MVWIQPSSRGMRWCGGLVAVVVLPVIAAAHPGHSDEQPADETYAAQPAADVPEPSKHVTIETRGEYRYITSDGLPNHPTGRFPNRGNPNTISAQEHRFRVPLNPVANERATDARGRVFGIAVNGVPFDPGTAEFWNDDRRWNYEALSGKIDLGVDQNNAHVQPTGAYHYHGIPTGLLKSRSVDGNKMVLLGYAADGFPIYGPMAHADANNPTSALRATRPSYRVKQGARPDDGPPGRYDGTFSADYEYVAGLGDLDECNGRTGVTPEYPEGTYYYVLTENWPFIPRLWRGTPDESFERRGPGGPPGIGPGGPGGPRGRDGRRGPGGRPPGPPPPWRDRPGEGMPPPPP